MGRNPLLLVVSQDIVTELGELPEVEEMMRRRMKMTEFIIRMMMVRDLINIYLCH